MYRSKVVPLNVILDLVDLTKDGFNLLFSTIGTAFSNAGQAPYLAAQLCVFFVSLFYFSSPNSRCNSHLDKIAEKFSSTI